MGITPPPRLVKPKYKTSITYYSNHFDNFFGEILDQLVDGDLRDRVFVCYANCLASSYNVPVPDDLIQDLLKAGFNVGALPNPILDPQN